MHSAIVTKFLDWYKTNMASKKELELWHKVRAELISAFVSGSGNHYCIKVCDLFWDKYRRGEF